MSYHRIVQAKYTLLTMSTSGLGLMLKDVNDILQTVSLVISIGLGCLGFYKFFKKKKGD